MQYNDIINLALLTWGEDAQLDCAVEEMAELIKEIIKWKRGFENKAQITEELADVKIMMDQVMNTCQISSKEVDDIITFKINRLEKRLEEYQNDK